MLKAVSGDGDIEARSNAGNFILDERLTKQREDSYFPYVNPRVDKNTWDDKHKRYVRERLLVPPAPEPETFTGLNRSNLLTLPEEKLLVRLEDAARLDRVFARPVEKIIADFEDFIKDPGNEEKQAIIKTDLDNWNKRRKRRPLFAGFWDDVLDIFIDASGNEIANKEWAGLLRDRFGLGHLIPRGGKPRPVVLLRYPVKKITPSHPDNKGKIAVPTVLDGPLYSFFCPSPKKASGYGLPVNLDPADDFPLTEVLHSFIEYEPDFIFRVGWIHRPPGKTLEKARRIHLELLADDFEKSLPGQRGAS
ncbi:MAG: hypothetical protein KAW12_05265 [Candidatus Aminicenantes bacterium]|nr:hypothetical protein [Candidatus Aminicenantes bacterium]